MTFQNSLRGTRGLLMTLHHASITTRNWMDWETAPKKALDSKELNAQLTEAVRSHLMGDVPYGLLISGGLDSSVIAAIAQSFSQKRVDDNGETEAWWPRAHSFSIGLEGSPDVAAAQKVADHIGTAHHPLTFTVQEGLDALEDVVKTCGNVRRDYHTIVHAHVPDGPTDQGYGHQNGLVWRRCR